jgi:hypothetical protein
MVTSVSVFSRPHHCVKLFFWMALIQPSDHRAPLARQTVEHLHRQRRHVTNGGIGGVRLESLLVESARVLLIAAQEVTLGDTDLRP